MEKQQVSRKQVLDLLAEGKTREEIRLHFGLTKRDLKILFNDSALKGKRTKVAPAFVLVDEEAPASVTETPVSTTVTATQQESTTPVVNTTNTATANPVVRREEESII